MPLTAVCPVCQASFPLEAALADAEARDALGALLALLPEREARLIPRYAALFAPEKKRVQWAKLARVLRELTERLQTGQVQRRGQVRSCPRGRWLDAIDAVLNNHMAGTLRVPLADHAYLDQVAWELCAPKGGSYTAPAAPTPRTEAEPALSQAQQRAAVVGLRRHVARLESLNMPVDDSLRQQLERAQAEAG